MELYATDVWWFFVMRSFVCLLYRFCWEYWEQHELLGWKLLGRWFYSPAQLYGSREDLPHLLSAYQTTAAFFLVNPYLPVLAALYGARCSCSCPFPCCCRHTRPVLPDTSKAAAASKS